MSLLIFFSHFTHRYMSHFSCFTILLFGRDVLPRHVTSSPRTFEFLCICLSDDVILSLKAHVSYSASFIICFSLGWSICLELVTLFSFSLQLSLCFELVDVALLQCFFIKVTKQGPCFILIVVRFLLRVPFRQHTCITMCHPQIALRFCSFFTCSKCSGSFAYIINFPLRLPLYFSPIDVNLLQCFSLRHQAGCALLFSMVRFPPCIFHWLLHLLLPLARELEAFGLRHGFFSPDSFVFLPC